MDSKCKCNNCSEFVGFDSGAAGQTVECPYCHMDTLLFIPPLQVVRTGEEPVPLEQQAMDALQKVASGVAEARCPRCNSDNTFRCEMAWQAGTTTSSFRGLGVDLGGDVGGFGGVKKSSTLLAANVAPPTKEASNSGVVLLVICAIVGCLISMECLSDDDTKPHWPWWFVLLGCIATIVWCSWWLGKDAKRRHEHYLGRVRVYLRQWVCMRCGTIYEV